MTPPARGRSVSRRRLLTLAPIAVMASVCGLSACGLPPVRPTVNIRDYGAVGDGTTDDSEAITAAVAALKQGQTLYFPKGSYRFARQRPSDGAAVVLSDISDVAVEFGDGAELVMDNLHDGVGTSHGILVRGPAAGITLRNVRIRWGTTPVRRSFGDGIRVVGFPADDARPPAEWTGSAGPVSDVRILDAEVRSSPQAGVIMMGVSDIRVDGLSVHDTLADGLHFNACRRGTVHNHRAFNTGDDGLALVTYHSDEFADDGLVSYNDGPVSYNNVAHTFSFPDLTEWSNADFTISNVTVVGGGANGVRLAGANGVRIRWLTVSGKRSGAGLIADSAAPGVDAGWFYVASRGVALNRARIDDCDMGLHLLARPNESGDPRFTAFGIEAANTTIRDCRVWGVRAESTTATPATGLRLDSCDIEADATAGGNGGVGLENVAGARLGRLSLRHADPVTVFSAVNCPGLAADDLTVVIDGPAGADESAAPCVSLQDSAGRIGELGVSWPDAPETWQPVRMATASGDCAEPGAEPGPEPGVEQTVEIATLRVEPATVQQPVIRC